MITRTTIELKLILTMLSKLGGGDDISRRPLIHIIIKSGAVCSGVAREKCEVINEEEFGSERSPTEAVDDRVSACRGK